MAAAEGLKGRLTRKLGPFPVWVWAAIVVGAYLLYRHYKSGSSTASALGGTAANAPGTGYTYVPSSDQSGGGGGSSGGGIGNSGVPVVLGGGGSGTTSSGSGTTSAAVASAPTPVASPTAVSAPSPANRPLQPTAVAPNLGGPNYGGGPGNAARAVSTFHHASASAHATQRQHKPLSKWQLAHPKSVLAHDKNLSAYQRRHLQHLAKK